MSARTRTLPLGIDIGRRRVRVALLERRAAEPPKLVAVAARDHAGDVVTALHESVAELQTAERRCILALSAPDAVLSTVELPTMSRWERASAVRFEAARMIDYPIGEADVAIARTETPQRWVIGIVRRAALRATMRVAKRVKLKPVAVDDPAFALHRAHPDADGAIDIGDEATRLMLFAGTVPYVARIPIGGEHLTDAIAQALGIDESTAERRKRQTGFAGAGDAQRDLLVASLGDALADARSAGHAGAARIVLCGNGSRIPELDEAIERATGHGVYPATLPPEISDTLPSDILRAAGADWSVAYGLALWSVAA
jgi:type IV pilus assembly protein PilM